MTKTCLVNLAYSTQPWSPEPEVWINLAECLNWLKSKLDVNDQQLSQVARVDAQTIYKSINYGKGMNSQSLGLLSEWADSYGLVVTARFLNAQSDVSRTVSMTRGGPRTIRRAR